MGDFKDTSVAKQQQTIGASIGFRGVGVHSGSAVEMTLHPADANTGIVFHLGNGSGRVREIAAVSANVSSTDLATVVGEPGGPHVATIEHLMAALYAMDVDNVIVEMDGGEIPIMDGCSTAFVEAIDEAGLVSQLAARRHIRVLKPVRVEMGGAFGEVQLRRLVEDRLPADGYSWQHTLSNRHRADCLIHLPHPPGPVVVDSKFPLEGWLTQRDAEGRERDLAAKAFASDMRKHVGDIAAKYLIPGETAEGALLFVPSEAIYAELHATQAPLVEEAARMGVYIVSPSTLWAVLGTMRALMQDVRIRAEARRIQDEVKRMGTEVGRLDTRVAKLKKHFSDMQDDVRMIDITTEKIVRASERMAAVELEEAAGAPPAVSLAEASPASLPRA